MKDSSRYKQKYLKYKTKYLQMKNSLFGGKPDSVWQPESGLALTGKKNPSFDSGNGDDSVKRHLALFERFVYDGYNVRNWDVVRQIYDKNVVLHIANGETVQGIENLIKNMQGGPGAVAKVTSHTIQFGSGDWIAVSMIMEGTFNQPIEMPDGKIIQPTGKKWRMSQAALVKWKNDKIIESNGFWDNGAFMQQIGVANC